MADNSPGVISRIVMLILSDSDVQHGCQTPFAIVVVRRPRRNADVHCGLTRSGGASAAADAGELHGGDGGRCTNFVELVQNDLGGRWFVSRRFGGFSQVSECLCALDGHSSEEWRRKIVATECTGKAPQMEDERFGAN